MSNTISFIISPDWTEHGGISDVAIDALINTIVGLKVMDSHAAKGIVRSAKRYQNHNAIVMEVEVIDD